MTTFVDDLRFSDVLPIGDGGWLTGFAQAPNGDVLVRPDSTTPGQLAQGAAKWITALRTNNTTPAQNGTMIRGDNVNLSAVGCYEVAIAPSDPTRRYTVFDYRLFSSDDSGGTWTMKLDLTAYVGTKTSISGARTSGVNTITGVTNIDGLWIGQTVTGTGIPANTTFTAFSGSGPYTVTMSANATTTTTGSVGVQYIQDLNGNQDWLKQCVGKMAVHPTNKDIILLGTCTQGILRSTNGGASFTRVGATVFPTITPTVNQCGVSNIQWSRDVARPTRVLAYQINNKIGYSDDDGVTWTGITGGPSALCFSIAQKSTGEAWCTEWNITGNVRKAWKLSAGASPTWTEVTANFLAGTLNGGNNPLGMTINPSNDNHIIMYKIDGNMYQSLNGGTSFGDVQGAQIATSDVGYIDEVASTFLAVGRIAFDRVDNNKLLCSFGLGYATVTYSGGTIYTVSTVTDWNALSRGMEQLISRGLYWAANDWVGYQAWDQCNLKLHDSTSRASFNHNRYADHVYGKGSALVGGIVDSGVCHQMPLDQSKSTVCFTRSIGTPEAGIFTNRMQTFTAVPSYPPSFDGSTAKIIMEFLALSTTMWVMRPFRKGLYVHRNAGIGGTGTWELITLPGASAAQMDGWASPSYSTCQRLTASKINPNTFWVHVPPEYNGTFSAILTPARIYKVVLGANSAADVITTVHTASTTIPAQGISKGGNSSRLEVSPYSETEFIYSSADASGVLMFSTDGCATFTEVADIAVESADFGKPAPGRTNPTIMMCGVAESKQGVYQTDDRFVSAVRRKALNPGNVIEPLKYIAASKSEYARWVGGFGGRGCAYGNDAPTAQRRVSGQF